MNTSVRFVCSLTACFALMVAGASALDLTVTPSTVDWNSNTWVDLVISNLTPNARVRCTLFLDVDQNRALGPVDQPLSDFYLQDGVSNMFGASYFPADGDGATNGVIQARFSYHGLDSLWHTIGSYLWVAATNPAMPVVQSFAVIQDTSTVWITGQVRSYSPPNAPIPGARVQLVYFSEAYGFEPAVWTDTGGTFRIDVPAGIGTADVRGVMAAGAGYFGALQTPDNQWLSAYPFWTPLSAGENVLTNALFLVEQPVPDMVYAVSGRVVMIEGLATNPVPGTLVQAEFRDSSGEDADLWSMDVTKSNGTFRLLSPANFNLTILLSHDMNVRRLVTELQEVYVETQNISGIVIRSTPAQSLVRGRVTDRETAEPIPGLLMFAYDETLALYGFGYTMGDGVFEIGVFPGSNYFSGCFREEAAWRAQHAPPVEEGPLSVPFGAVFTNLSFQLLPARQIRGRVFDALTTNALLNGTVEAYTTNEFWTSVSRADVNLNGEYRLQTVSGDYRIRADGFAGYLPMSWSNHFQWEWSNGPVFDAVSVSTADVFGIDFYLHPGAIISGIVRGDGVPLQGVEVRALLSRADGGWDWRGNAFTDTNGFYEITVLGGTNYIVQAEAPSPTFWLNQFYSNAYYFEDATPVYTEAGAPATNINFDLVKGGRLEGQLYDPDGVSPFNGAVAFVAGLDESNTWINGAMADPTDGSFGVAVPAGTYRVRGEAPGWLAQYYGGFFDYQWQAAPVVTVGVEEVVGGLNITMTPPSYVEGQVTSAGSPLPGVRVEVDYVFDTDNWFWSYIADGTTGPDGHYTISIPPGSDFAVRAMPGGGSGYTEEWWSNAPNVEAAILLTVARTVTVSNINFDLASGMRLAGRVTDESGSPLADALIEAWRMAGESWTWAAQATTDSNGDYTISVDAATSYVVALRQPWSVPFESWWYPTMYFSNTYFAADAQRLWTNAGATVSNLDFRALPGVQLTGRVLRAVGGAPVNNAQVFVSFGSTTGAMNGTMGDPDGGYRICVPTNWALYVQANAIGYGPRWFSNTWMSSSATPIWGTAYTRLNIPFELGAYGDDLDGDGFDEYAETYVIRTDPLNSNDYLRAAQSIRTDSGVEIRWLSRPGVTYWIQRTESLIHGSWTDFPGPIIGTGDWMSVLDTNAPPAAAYRIMATAMSSIPD